MTTPGPPVRRLGMTSRGKQVTVAIAIVIAFFIPKHVDCGYPEATCGHVGMFKQFCTPYELEPLGFYLIERALHRDVGFAYSSGERCR